MLTRANRPRLVELVKALRKAIADQSPRNVLDDHIKAVQELLRVPADEPGPDLPDDLSPEQRKQVRQLWGLVGANPRKLAYDVGFPALRDEILAFLDGLLTELCGDPGADTLTEEDYVILTVLHRAGRALSFRAIEKAATELNRQDRNFSRVCESTIRTRVPYLQSAKVVARPLGTKKKGVAITSTGEKRLAQSHRKLNG
jgi:hypothetical protein